MATGSDLLIGDVFTNAARAVPDRMAAALGDRVAHLRRARVRRQPAGPGPRHARDRPRVAGRRCGSATDARRRAAVRRPGQARAPSSSPSTGCSAPRRSAGILATCRPDLVVTDGTAAGVPAGDGASTLDELGRSADGRARRRPVDGAGLTERDPHVAFFTSGSTGRPKGAVLSHRANYLRTHPGRAPRAPGRHGLPLSAVPHGGVDHRPPAVAGPRRRGAARTRPAPTRSATPWPGHRATRLNCIPAVWRRIIDHVGSSGTGHLWLRSGSPTPARRPPRPSCSTPSPDSLPDAHLRVFYGSTEAGSVACLDHADIAEQAGQLRSAGPRRRGPASTTTASCGCRSPLLFDGYLDDPGATAAGLVDGWYRTGDLAEEDDDGYLSHRGPHRRRDPHRGRGRGARRGRGRAGRAPDGAPRWRWSGCPTPRGARWSAPWWWPSPARPAPTARGSAGPVRRPPGRLQAPPAAPGGRRPCRARRHRPGPAPPAGRAPGGRPDGLAEHCSVSIRSLFCGTRAHHHRHRGPGGAAGRGRPGPGGRGRGPRGPGVRELRRDDAGRRHRVDRRGRRRPHRGAADRRRHLVGHPHAPRARRPRCSACLVDRTAWCFVNTSVVPTGTGRRRPGWWTVPATDLAVDVGQRHGGLDGDDRGLRGGDRAGGPAARSRPRRGRRSPPTGPSTPTLNDRALRAGFDSLAAGTAPAWPDRRRCPVSDRRRR